MLRWERGVGCDKIDAFVIGIYDDNNEDDAYGDDNDSSNGSGSDADDDDICA